MAWQHSRSWRAGCPVARLALALVLVALPVLLATTPAGAYGVALQTGIAGAPLPGGDGEAAIARTRGTGAQFFKLSISWKAIAPATPPPGFQPANPYEPSYLWASLDHTISNAVAHGLTPVLDILEPPAWARSPAGGSAGQPDLNAFAQFVNAIASRYDGAHLGLPRVAYWEVWNEPNVSFFLEPQIEGGNVVSVGFYRAMVNQFSSIVHGVNPGNVVIGGALFPNSIRRPGVVGISPLEFTRQLFCLSGGGKPHLTCSTKVAVDAWSVHPYTSGGPSTQPANRENVWIANLGSLSSLVKAAQRLGSLVSAHPAQTWVSEFSWDSKPPDPAGVPVGLEQRWVAEALYRAWGAGVSVFTWFRLADDPLSVSSFQSGLYYYCASGSACGAAKPAAAAFRFPFVAYTAAHRRVLVWGRAPSGATGKVRIQWLAHGRWRTFATLASDRDGIFTAKPLLPRKADPKNSKLRALRANGEASPAFSLHRPPDIAVTPFGT